MGYRKVGPLEQLWYILKWKLRGVRKGREKAAPRKSKSTRHPPRENQ